MIQNYSIWKVLRVFFDDPNPKEGFTIRWISTEIGLAPTSVKLHLDELTKEKGWGYPLAMRSKGRSYPTYWANQASELFRFYKRMDIIFRLEESGILEKIMEEHGPKAIVLFGSASRGEDVKGSDIDLFLHDVKGEPEIQDFEHLKRNIQYHLHPFNKIEKELRNNIINGIRLRGYLKVF